MNKDIHKQLKQINSLTVGKIHTTGTSRKPYVSDEVLLQMYQEGLSYGEISQKVGRCYSVIRNRITAYGVSKQS